MSPLLRVTSTGELQIPVVRATHFCCANECPVRRRVVVITESTEASGTRFFFFVVLGLMSSLRCIRITVFSSFYKDYCLLFVVLGLLVTRMCHQRVLQGGLGKESNT